MKKIISLLLILSLLLTFTGCLKNDKPQNVKNAPLVGSAAPGAP